MPTTLRSAASAVEEIAELRRRRRIEVGPFATFYFENFATMSVQFVKFRFASNLISRFRAPGAEVGIGFDHPNYTRVAGLPEPVRAALAEDFD
jgi:hypothetical protein